MAEIILTEPRFLEAKVAPTESDIVLFGLRRELAVEEVPPSLDHGRLIRTVHRNADKIIQRTYKIDSPRDNGDYRLTLLGSAEGPKISELYQNRLNKAGL